MVLNKINIWLLQRISNGDEMESILSTIEVITLT